ncbi:MAG: M81 family metallopeptidase [Proteobacteria bacterium]|nr:M81 family metallopeptidase [Pseudomonadota bacterium]
MRLLLAMMKHETNTFSPIPTDLQRFRDWGLHEGAAVAAAYAGTNHPLGAYLDLAREAGAEVVTPIAAEAMPSGPVQKQAYDTITGRVLDALEGGGFDGALLDLHGAMVAEDEPDGEGGLLARMRAIAPELPIAVTCDLHCNLSQRMVANSTAIIGYKTYPHVDMYQVGAQVGRILLRTLAGEVEPVMVWGDVPLLAQTLCMGTADAPMGPIQDMTREVETGPVLAATLFGGFPLADIPEARVASVVVADGDRAAAETARDRLLDAAWAAREDFVYRGEPLAAALARAQKIETGPVVLLDHADNVGSGGTEDCMTVIAAVLEAALRDVAVAAVWDPGAVTEMAAAGVGAEMTLNLGGKTDMPSVGETGRPLRLTGRVRALTDGRWIVRGPMYTGSEVSTGPTAVFETGGVKIVVVSKHHEPWDTGIFTSAGIEPQHCHYLLLKSRIHYRAGFAPLAKATIACDGTGVTTSDNARLTFERVKRPIFPLDRPLDWNQPEVGT